MNETLLLADVGGTNTRLSVMDLAADMLHSPNIIQNRAARISRKQSFLDFLANTLCSLESSPSLAVLCFAGPVSNGAVSMTNWDEVPDIYLDELVRSGLPAEACTLMVNDMDAAAASLVAHHRKLALLDLITLSAGSAEAHAGNHNSVIIIPGTGTGVAGLIEDILPGGGKHLVTVSCELQHTPIPELDEMQARVLGVMRSEYPESRPSWEDFISGKGLEHIYSCLPHRNGGSESKSPEVVTAEEIARRAIHSKDDRCLNAMDIFYRCAGSLAQLLALGFQAFGGVYLAGESTRYNLDFIRQSGFMEAFHENGVRRDWIKKIPVYLTAADVNLAGTAMIAAQYAGLLAHELPDGHR